MTPLRKIAISIAALGSVAVGAVGLSSISSANAAPATSASAGVATSDTVAPVGTSDSSGTSTSTDAATAPAADGSAQTPPADGGHGGGAGAGGGAPAGPHTANGITEAVLSGDTATSVEAAVKAAYPDATIDRMETDAEGAVYEAHITKADGSDATVKLDASFAITETVTGHG